MVDDGSRGPARDHLFCADRRSALRALRSDHGHGQLPLMPGSNGSQNNLLGRH